MKDLHDAIKDRHSYYGIGAQPGVSDNRILEVIGHAVQYTPSAFHSQSARVAVLFGERHKTLWNSIAADALKKVVPAGQFAPTQEKLDAFAAGYATVLFFDDTSVTNALAEKFPLYKDVFPVWAQHANGMLQYTVWSSLEAEGLGASLQHYNPLIDAGVEKAYGIPPQWKLIAQMPFGSPTAAPEQKEYQPLSQRMLIIR